MPPVKRRKKMKKLEQWLVYKISPNGRCRLCIAEFETEKEAVDFCDDYGWEMTDKNGFAWYLEYEQANGI